MAIGLGEPKHAARYCGRLAPSVECLVNQSNDVHLSYGLKRSNLTALFNPKLYAASARAAAAGLKQGKSTGDIAMLGGIFVVDAQGLIRYTYVNDFAGDNPPILQILKDLGAGAKD